ncbi:hypothetical protein chiPu_0003998 [Chiloscyllium punctatum]|uniref:Insulin-like domain-containing protein n=1 Tax=Chiloscyllium punctatum TaxID=137246 RepID=A0A401S5B8_CHIPU|nr:hypothetical protein [Chiloscyllium punctatum]
MKCLVFILMNGLMLKSSAVSNNPDGKDINEKIKLCGKDFLDKVIETCGGWIWGTRSNIPGIPDPAGVSDNNEDFEEDNTKTFQRIYDDDEIQQLRANYDQQPIYNDNNHYEKKLDDFNDYISDNKEDSMMQLSLAEGSKHIEVIKRDMQFSDRCCNFGCSIKELSIVCEP